MLYNDYSHYRSKPTQCHMIKELKYTLVRVKIIKLTNQEAIYT